MEGLYPLMRLAPGDQVDRYVLETVLGEGGQGQVWRARDPLHENTPRALKLVDLASTTSAQLERLRREARQLVQLSHPSLVACFGLFEDLHRELLGIVTEFVDAQSLAEVLGDARFTDKARFSLLVHVASALGYVHQRNVVHRDVKLENVLVTRDFWGNPEDPAGIKLIDFGIAVQSENPRPLTQLGHVIGTPPYLAPEQLEPEVWGGTSKNSAKADIFSFGILAWKLLRGDADAHPTQLGPDATLGQYAAAYRRAQQDRWPVASPVLAWSRLLERALALQPGERIQNGLELLTSLSELAPNTLLQTAQDTAPAPVFGRAAQPETLRTAPNTAERRRGSSPGSTEPGTLSASPVELPAPRTIPGAPPVLRQTVGGPSFPIVAPPPEKKSGSSIILVAGGVALGVCATVSLVVGSAMSSHAPAASSGAKSVGQPAETVSTGAVNAGQIDADANVGEGRRTRPLGCAEDEPLCGCCRPGQTCCPSGRDCAGFCDDLLKPGESFRLRLAGARATPTTDLYTTNPDAEVCVLVSGQRAEPVCTRLSEIRSKLAPYQSLVVTTEDLTMRGLDISVRDAAGTVTRMAAKHKPLTRAAICQGVIYTSGFSGPDSLAVEEVDFFLDDRGDPRPARCVGEDPHHGGTNSEAQPSSSTWAAGVDPVSASALQPDLNQLAAQFATGAKPVGSVLVGNFRRGQTLESFIQLQPGKCYTAVATSAGGVGEVNLRFVSINPIPGASRVLAEDKSEGARAVLGPKPNCWKNAFPMMLPVKFVLEVERGSGIAAAQLYEK